MKSKSLFTKLVAFMLCVIMAISCLPVSAFATENDWESEIDVTETEPPAGSEANPIDITADLLYEEDNQATVIVPANSTYYFIAYRVNGLIMQINGGEETVCTTPDNWTPYAFTITNDSAAEASYLITVAYPEGSMSNPAEAVLGDNAVSIEAGNNQGYYLTYIAEESGDLSFQISDITAGVEGDISVTNMNTYENRTIAADGVDGVLEMTVAAGDELQIVVSSLPDESWNWPAADITFEMTYAAIAVEDLVINNNTIALSFQDYIGMNFLVNVTNSTYDEVYVEAVQATWKDGDVITNEVTKLEGTEMKSGKKTYLFFDKPVVAWSMAENVTFTLYGVKDGQLYKGQVSSTTVKDLAMGMIEKYAPDTTKEINCKVLVNMLNYGAAVQTQFNHNANVLPNADLGEYASFATEGTPAMNTTNTSDGSGDAAFYGNPSVSMQDKVLLMLAVRNTTLENYEMRYTVGGVTTPVTEYVAMSSKISAGCIAVKATQMREEFTVALYDKTTGEVASVVWTLTVEAFAKNQIGGTNEAVAVAMMKYGDSVAEYAA